MAKEPIQKYRLTVQYPPSSTRNGGAYVKDEDGVKNFGDASLLNLEQKDMIDVERTYNPPKGKFDSSFTIVSWKPYASGTTNHPDQQQLPVAKPFLRPRTDPHDQMQMWITALMKEWMTAYSATLMLSAAEPPATMRPVNAQVVVRAMEALATAYRQFNGIRTQSGEDLQEPPPREDMDDQIPDFR